MCTYASVCVVRGEDGSPLISDVPERNPEGGPDWAPALNWALKCYQVPSQTTWRWHMAKWGSGEELVERGNGAEGLAPPAAKFFLSLWVFRSGRRTAWVIVHLASRCANDDRAKLTPLWWGQMEMRLVSLSALLLSRTEHIHLLQRQMKLWKKTNLTKKNVNPKNLICALRMG